MFDYVIIGAGSAGCVLANRLSQTPANNVLLLEAGGKDWNPFIHMPAGVGELLKKEWVNWYFYTAPETKLNNRSLYWPRGKVLGGSSSMNGMIYIRGHYSDYDDWVAQGCVGWSWKEVLPYFKKSEHFFAGANAFHGVGGPIAVSEGTSGNPLFDMFIAAGKEAGMPYTADFNGAQQEGVGPYHLTIGKGRRSSAATAYLTPIRLRSNLSVKTHAHVTRIIFEGKKAVGVEYWQKGELKQVRAKREVILSAGAVQSPQILMLSGIGDANNLQQTGIQTLHHLPGVGQNLQDHLDVGIQYQVTQPITLYSQAFKPRAIKSLIQYWLFGTGLGTSNGLEAGAFVKTKSELTKPDVQLHFIPAFMLDHARQDAPGHGMMVHACQLRPESRGYIALNSADPLDAPVIQPNYLSAEKDVRVLVDAIKICRKLFSANAFKSVIGAEYAPGVNVTSDEEIEAFIRRSAETIYHPVGSCKMGVDELAVVDPQLKVRGVENLRVVDASVMPTLIGGNTNAPTIMIAEKAADLILGIPQ